MQTVRLLPLLLLAWFATACASIKHGPTQLVPVSSEPEGAVVTVDCGRSETRTATTPTRVRLDRRAEACSLALQLDGYEPLQVVFERGFSPWYWGNFAGSALIPIGISDGGPSLGDGETVLGLAITGLAGLLVDRVSGAQYRLEPASVHVVLRRKGSSTFSKPDLEDLSRERLASSPSRRPVPARCTHRG